MEPVRRDEQCRGPGVGSDAARHDALMCPGVTPGSGPAVGEVVRADDQDAEADDGQQEGPEQPAAALSDEAAHDGPDDRDGGGDAQRAERHDRHRHHEHGRGRGRRVRRRPLPADGELGPDGEGEHDEDGQRRADGDEAAASAVLVVERLAAQSRRRRRAPPCRCAPHSSARPNERGRSSMSETRSSTNSSP